MEGGVVEGGVMEVDVMEVGVVDGKCGGVCTNKIFSVKLGRPNFFAVLTTRRGK